MKKTKLIFLFILMLTLFVSCGEQTPEGPNKEETETLEVKEIKIVHNDHNVIYLGDKFTAEGYDVFIVYTIVNSGGKTKEVKCENYTIDDSRVDYSKKGSYQVTFVARVKNRVFKRNATIRIAESYLCELGIKHLYGIKADEYSGADLTIGQTDFSSVDIANVYLIYTEGKYEGTELITTEEKKRNGYELDFSAIDTSKAGSYPVYVRFTESYDVNGEAITVTVETFFIVNVK